MQKGVCECSSPPSSSASSFVAANRNMNESTLQFKSFLSLSLSLSLCVAFNSSMKFLKAMADKAVRKPWHSLFIIIQKSPFAIRCFLQFPTLKIHLRFLANLMKPLVSIMKSFDWNKNLIARFQAGTHRNIDVSNRRGICLPFMIGLYCKHTSLSSSHLTKIWDFLLGLIEQNWAKNIST